MTNERSRPNVLLVVAHPDHESATWAIARAVEQGIQADGNTTATTHDLTKSGFDPVFSAADLAVHRLVGEVPEDVRREQELIESADVVALLFPVYWWSMPALAKGWIDRVFSRGWAYENPSPNGPSAIDELHFIALAGVNQRTFDRRGYKDSISLQLQHGIADYSEIAESSIEILYGTETSDPQAHQELAAQGYKLGADLAQRAQAAFDRSAHSRE
ncbi:NAD(P)H-dependent oxidoreductase [Nocardia colli]|uniref:NAD(P)H-dependent oxidoreductase n=1 Tax=Nocardia colli TaxID=2545717 RepID=UPI00168D72A4|nr:NAD(P)H-dependent oxidoreductase [Nocardia colli]